MAFVSRGFVGKPRGQGGGRVPHGQHLTEDFPVLSAGPTPRTSLDAWTFTLDGLLPEPRRWTWAELQQLPREEVRVDIHCVTTWSKLGTRWEGVSVDTLLEGVETEAQHALAFCDGGYTTNVPMEDLRGGKAWVVFGYEGAPLALQHGGPARLLVPHLYFWKSAKWVRGLTLLREEKLGFWESLGYHARGDPWQEQRYAGD